MLKNSRTLRPCALAALACALLAGCARPADAPKGSDQIKPSYNPKTGRLEKITYDRNHDGKASRVEFFEKGQRVRVEEDADGDGQVDKWETWANGAQSRIVLDTDGDGRPDRRLTYYQDGSDPLFEKADADGRFPTP
jgi:hypothetical protein